MAVPSVVSISKSVQPFHCPAGARCELTVRAHIRARTPPRLVSARMTLVVAELLEEAEAVVEALPVDWAARAVVRGAGRVVG